MALTVASAPQLVALRRQHEAAAGREAAAAARRDEAAEEAEAREASGEAEAEAAGEAGEAAAAGAATLLPLPLPPKLERLAVANLAHACRTRLEGYPRSLEADRAALGRAAAHSSMRRVLLLRVAEQAWLG